RGSTVLGLHGRGRHRSRTCHARPRQRLAANGGAVIEVPPPGSPSRPAIRNLTKLGFNHICFAVDDLQAEVARLKAKGVKLRNEVMEFHGRKLVFLSGPEGVTVELAEWR